MKRLAAFAALGVAVAAAALLSGLAPLERGLDALRFRLLARDVSAPVVVVAIDPASLRALDVWPWARGYHATVLENLLSAGATRVGFDVDFSSRSIPEEDAELEAALAASGRRVVLPTFRQWEGGTLRATAPLPRFSRHAALGTINILPDGDGLLRAYRASSGERSFAGALLGDDAPPHEAFFVDFALRPESIREIPYVDALTGSFDPALAEGRVAIVGATAVELGDQVAVPLHASLAGPTLQALAYASLAEGRALRRTSPAFGIAAALLVAIGLGVVLDRAPWRLGLLATVFTSLALFAGSAAVLAFSPVLVETAPGITAAASAYALALVRRLDRQSFEMLLQALRLRRSETAMRRVVERSFDAIVTVDGQGRIETWNPAAERLLGRKGAEIAGVPLSRFLTGVSSGRGASVGEGEVSRDAGTPVPIDFTVGEIESEEGTRRVYVLRDATDRKAHETALLRRATHDALTDLPNRSLLALRADERIRARQPLALVLLDLDRFREINDALGHDAGDVLLREIAARFLARLAPGATLARLGGDEFGVLLPGAGEGEARAAAARLADGLAVPFEVRGLSLHVDASLGVALHPQHGRTGTELVQRADVAMYAAKREGRSLVVYRPELDFHGTRHLTLRADLARALETGGLALHYQPKISARTGALAGAEALARWAHPTHGVLPPEEFIGLAEHTGLIHPLTAFVLEEAATQWAAWRREGRSVGIAVNISARSLRGDDLVSRVGGVIRKHDLPPGALTLEITESVIMDDPRRALEVVTRLVDMGCRFSIDDFGTGYSSLAYLRRLPAREVKIDKSFVRGMESDPGSVVIVRSILDMAHHLGLEVVAEGVETAEVWERLREAGCDYGQGWLFGKPAPARELAVESFAVR